jgi:EAL domain-containing protein (putative c-di-GMP-specific phosphodiesterase class I)
VRDAGHPDCLAVAERIRRAMQDPVEIENLTLELELSIGIANCPAHSQDGNTLLRYADIAMYVAKRGATAIETYSPERDPNSADRLSLLGQLRQALDADTIELRYQPKVTTHDGTPLGFEALVRWHHSQRGFVPPDEFVPLAEHSGIMPLLTERVVTLAVAQMARWRDQGLYAPVAVNISPTDLADSRLTRLVAEQLREHRLPARMLQLEITERIVASQDEQTNRSLRELREMGVTISLDDFGTGYSSLQRLQSVPVDELKIDRVFVSGLTGDNDDSVGIVRAMVELAHALGLPAVAEGVETAEEWRVLRSLGCDGVQGWRVSRPMTVPAATQWLRSHSALRYLAPVPAAPLGEPVRSSTGG